MIEVRNKEMATSRQMKHRIAKVGILWWFLSTACLAGCGGKSAPDDAAGGEGAANAVAEVTVTKVVRADIRDTVAISGSVAGLPNQDVKVSSLVSGRVSELSVAEGDMVHAGQVLAKIDSHSYHDQLLQAEAAKQQAEAALENAQLSAKRNADLFQRGIAARKDMEDARMQESVTTAALRQAEAVLSIAKLQLDRTEIRSPLNGRVAKRFVSVGEQVDGTAAQPIVEVANLQEVELLGNLPAIYLAKLNRGESLEIESDAFTGRKFAGKVIAISPAVDPLTGQGVVRVRIANSEGLLRLGMFLTTQVAVEDHKNALTIPAEALYRDEKGDPQVYVVEGEKATAADVKVGIQGKERVEILEGVKEGDTVIRTGGYGLPDTAKVHVKS